MIYTETQSIIQDNLNEIFEKNNYIKNIVISSKNYRLEELPGILAYDKEEIFGFLTYNIDDNYLEIISLNSYLENFGVGTNLLKMCEDLAVKAGIQTIKVTITNENIKALYFYQKRGYRIVEILPNEASKGRKIHPNIPYVGENGIQVTDEIILLKRL